jgi:hypothetical protein
MNLARPLAAAAALAALALPATAAAKTTESFFSPRGGEALVALTAAAPGTDWGTAGAESAVRTLRLDGRKVEDLVLFAGAQPFTYRAALGRVGAGRQRDYLFAEVKKTTTYPQPPATGTWVGTALPVKLAGDPALYASNHAVPDWSIQRDDPAATTVELPAGTTPDDVESIRAVAVPVAATAPPAPAPADYRIEVTALNRGFMLGESYLPGQSFVAWQGSAVLTPAQPAAVIWSAARE